MIAEVAAPGRGQKVRQYTFAGLFSMIKGSEDYLTLLRTAATTGWLTDGIFVTKLTDDELDRVKEVYLDTPEARRYAAVEVNLPETVGPLAFRVEPEGKTVRLTSAGGVSVRVDASLFYTLQRRHPKAGVYLWRHDTPVMPVIFSERNTVALLAPITD